MKTDNKLNVLKEAVLICCLFWAPCFGEHLLKMRAVDKEQASLFGDPQYKDTANGDFSFWRNSPALNLGIEPLDVSTMGRGDMAGQATHYPAFSWETVPVGFHFGKSASLRARLRACLGLD